MRKYLILIVPLFLFFILPAVSGLTLTSYENSMLNKINSVRINNGLLPLSLDTTLSGVARMYSQEMITHGFFDHISAVDSSDPFQRVERSGYYDSYSGLRMVAENLGLTSEKIDIEFMVEEWMGSSGHRANILNTIVNEIGVGIIQGTFQNNPNTALYTVIFTFYFGDEVQPTSTTSQTSSKGFSLTTFLITSSTRTRLTSSSSSTRNSFTSSSYTSSSNIVLTRVSTIVYLQQSKTRSSSTYPSSTPTATMKETKTTMLSMKTSILSRTTSTLETTSSIIRTATVNLGFSTLANPYPPNISTMAAIPGFPPFSMLLGFLLFLPLLFLSKRRNKAS